jgi:hypothetical protein
VVYVLIFLIVLLGYNLINLSDGIKRIDLDNSMVKCNFYPDYKEASFRDVNLYLSAIEVEPYDYKDFYTIHVWDVETIISFCTGMPREQINTVVQQGIFDEEKRIGDAALKDMLEKKQIKEGDLEKAATYQNHVFDITPAFTYVPFLKLFLIGNIVILLVFEITRRIFYYIVLGSFIPPK